MAEDLIHILNKMLPKKCVTIPVSTLLRKLLEAYSCCKKIELDVPQGSILGAVLYLQNLPAIYKFKNIK